MSDTTSKISTCSKATKLSGDFDHLQRAIRSGQPKVSHPMGETPPRVLIVDDSPTIRFSLRRDLAQMGAVVTEAAGRQ